jgi:hypothetical protein
LDSVAAVASDQRWRPFWLHQGAEYLVAVVLVASGLQATEPLWPSLAGGLVLVNAALSGPPLGAFRAVPRRLHRRLDLVVIGVLVVIAALPMIDMDSASRLTILLVAAVLAVVWWGTNFAEAGARRRPGGPALGPLDSETIGRTAGRLYARANEVIKKRQQS